MKTRTEKEMMDLILGFAKRDDRVRVVWMNGSRASPNAARDPFQDYDIAYFVTDVEPFRSDKEYVTSHFDGSIVSQETESKEWPPPVGDGSCSYQFQFTDGNRIDLGIHGVDRVHDRLGDSQTRVLMDKDGIVPELPPPSDRDYFITEPTKQLYDDCCDEFFFGLGSHIPKTFWRRQLPLLKFYVEVALRKPLVMMLGWEIGMRTGSEKSIGKEGKYLQGYLEPDVWRQFASTYAGAGYDAIWESMLVFHSLFTRTARIVSRHYGFPFPEEDAKGALAFLDHVKHLPPDATTIY